MGNVDGTPLNGGNASLLKSKARRDMIQACSRLCQLIGIPRSIGQIYGLMYLSTKPLSLDEMRSILGISKGSASMGTRQLISWGAIRQVWIPGERKDHYEILADLGALIRNTYSHFVKPKVNATGNRLKGILDQIDEDAKGGDLTPEEAGDLKSRVKSLKKLQHRFETLMPIAEKLM